MRLSAYDTGQFYDELIRPGGQARPGVAPLLERVTSLPEGELARRQQAAERDLLNLGITFTVYGDEAGTERIFPFDILPRIVSAADWAVIENGLKQRIQALNLFSDDVYHAQRIIKDGVVPEDLIRSARNFLQPCLGLNPPQGIWCHVSGIRCPVAG